jgi:hypothetical protein
MKILTVASWIGLDFFLPQSELHLVFENPSIYLFRVDPASNLLVLGLSNWTEGWLYMFLCEPLAATAAHAYAGPLDNRQLSTQTVIIEEFYN